MNARDIIKLAAQLYVYDALKKKITILTNIQKGKDINVDIFLPNEHNGIKSDQIEYGVLLCMDCHTERHHGKKCNDVKEYCRKYLINLYGESIYSK